MIRVVIESPFAGETSTDIADNIVYARRCMVDCIQRGEAPYASHLLFTQPNILDDTNPEQRNLGIKLGFKWGECAEKTVVYLDRGVSKGMRRGIREARLEGREVEYRAMDISLEWAIANIPKE